MELRHIRYFLAVAEQRNFTRAATAVGIGQSPLSQQIRDLEREIGAPLFHRIPQGAELTAAGEAFLGVVQSFPTQAERAVLVAQRAARGEIGSLALGFTASSAFNPVVPTAIRSFRRAYPDVSLTLEEANTRRLVTGLSEGTLDAAFLRPGSAGTENFRTRQISEEPLVVALPQRHRLAGEDVIDLRLLADECLILFPREMGTALYHSIIDAFRGFGVEPTVGQTAPQIASIINLVAAAVGFSLVPASMSAIKVAGVEYRGIAGIAPVARISLAWRADDRNKLVRNFLSCATA